MNIEDQLRKTHDPDVDDYSIGGDTRLHTLRRINETVEVLTCTRLFGWP